MTVELFGTPRAICIGEGMLELRLNGAALDTTKVATGGDTLNTAAHLARCGIPVGYLSAMGDDGLSDQLVTAWEKLGVECSTVARIPGASPGIYAISLDAQGERSFRYWRADSAARRLWSSREADAAIERAATVELLYLTGITLSLTDAAGRERLFDLLRRARANGGRVAFDINYRPAGWPNRDTARDAVKAALGCVDVALPSVEDAELLFGATEAVAVADLVAASGCGEIVVKDGARGSWVRHASDWTAVPPERVVKPVDTTGAGDSFNAGYLAARLHGLDVTEAARAGNALAAATVLHRGALPDV